MPLPPEPRDTLPFETELLRHGPFLRRLALALVRDEHAAEDLVHETWVAALCGRPSGVRDVRAWLATVLRRRATSELRRRGVRASSEAPEQEPSVPSAAATVLVLERERLLHEAVAGLDEPYRTAIFLRYHEGLPPRRIAAQLGVPVKTVATRLERGRARLRQRLDRSFGERDDSGRPGWLLALAPLVSPERVVVLSQPLLGAAMAMKIAVPAVLALLALLLVPLLMNAGGPARKNGTAGVRRAGSESAGQVVDDVVVGEVSGSQEARVVPLGPTVTTTTQTGGLVVTVQRGSGVLAPEEIVIVDGPYASGGRTTVQRRTTDGSGESAFDSLLAGRYQVTEGAGRALTFATVEPGVVQRVTLALADGVFVRGRVLRPDGSPAPGARVWGDGGQARPERWIVLATTGPNGRFELAAGLELGLQASLPGHVPSNGQKVERMPETEPGVRSAELVLGPAGAVLTGRVLDEAGAPIEGARIGAGPLRRTVSAAWVGHSPGRVIATSDANGCFVYPNALPNGPTTVSAYAPGRSAAVREVEGDCSPIDIELVLLPAARIRGTVRTTAGIPVAVAEIVLHDSASTPHESSDRPHVRATTDAEGHFALDDASTGLHMLVAETKAPLRLRARVELDLVAGETREIELIVDEGDVIAGRVVDRDGVGVADIQLGASTERMFSDSQWFRSGNDGSFRMTGLNDQWGNGHDRWTVTARHLSGVGFGELARVEDVAVGTEDLLVVVDRPSSANAFIEGVLVSGDTRVPADVELSFARAGTRASRSGTFEPSTGRFRHGPVTAGTYSVMASRDGALVAMRSGIELRNGETVDVGAIVLGSGGHVAVTTRLANLHGFPPELGQKALDAGDATIVNANGIVDWLERDGDRWASVHPLEPGTWTFRCRGKNTFYPKLDFTVVDGETTELECVAHIGHTVDINVQLPTSGWERVRVRLVHSEHGNLHETEWKERSATPSANFEVTIPIGSVRVEVETDTDLEGESDVAATLTERLQDVEIDLR